MQVKSIAECSMGEHSAILSTFIKLPYVFKTFVLSIFEWPLKTGFTVYFKNAFMLNTFKPNGVSRLYLLNESIYNSRVIG